MSRKSLAGAAVSLCVLSVTAAANPRSDLFDPDVFGTAHALEQRTPGLTDPLGRTCAPPANPLSLPAAVDLALCRNPATRSAWAGARQQADALGAAEGARLPSLEITGSEARVYAGEHADLYGDIVSTPQTTRDAALNLSWTLYDFGNRGGRIASAHRLLDAAAATLNRSVQQTVLNVVQNFYSVVAADAALGAAKSTEAANARALEIARALREGGVGSLADVLQAETAFDQAQLARIQAEYTARSALGALAVAVGMPADRPLQLEAAAVPDQVTGWTARMEDLMAQAQRQRPDLKAALAQRDAAEASVTVARAVGRPSISIQAGRSVSETTDFPNQNYNQVGVYVTVPIFNGFSTAYGVRQAQAALEASEANADQVRLAVSLDVWNAYYSLQSAIQQLTATGTLVKTAQQNQELALGRYQSGVGTIIDLLTAQTAAANALQTRVTAELNWQVARAQLALALGRLSGTEPLESVRRCRKFPGSPGRRRQGARGRDQARRDEVRARVTWGGARTGGRCGGDQNRPGAGPPAELDVRCPIPDHHGRGRVEVQFRRRPVQEAERGLAAVAASLGRVPAAVNPRETRADVLDHALEPRIHGGHPLQGEVAAAHAGLVGDDDEAVAVVVQPFEALGGARREFQSRRVVQVAAIDYHRSVAIEDRDLVGGHRRVHADGEAATRLTVPVVLCPVSSSASTTFPPRSRTRSAPTTFSSA